MGSVLDSLCTANRKGALLELVLMDALSDVGFQNVRRQLSGNQYGYDLIANRKSPIDGRQESWLFECKNLSRPITVEEIAPKLVWHYGQAAIDRFVIVGTSPISNDLDHLLRQHQFSMQIGVWTDSVLERLVESSPEAMRRLGLSFRPGSPKPDLDELPSYPQTSISFEVAHQLDPPYTLDYVEVGGEVVKAFSSFELRILATVSNPTRAVLNINSLEVVTASYLKEVGRVVRLMKQKGIFQPLELRFLPSRNVGGSSDVLGGKVWRVNGGATESVALLLDERAPAGLYHVAFTIKGTLDGRPITRSSSCFAIHVAESDGDILAFNVFGKYYDSPAAQVLRLDEAMWGRLRGEADKPGRMVFLGPAFHEVMTRQVDPTWIIRACEIEPGANGMSAAIDYTEPTTVLLDLGTPVDEELYTQDKIMSDMLGAENWQKLLPSYLANLKRRPGS
jgi:hypothetical protein